MVRGSDVEDAVLPYTELLKEQGGLCVENCFFCTVRMLESKMP